MSDMGKELESIGQLTSVGDLPEKLTDAEDAKVEVEGQLLERVGHRGLTNDSLPSSFDKNQSTTGSRHYFRTLCYKRLAKSGNSARKR